MSTSNSIALDGLDVALASKVREVIETNWRKHLADIQYLSVRRFYERRLAGGIVSYQPTNRYVLRVQFRYAREPRQTIFTLV